MDRAREAGPSDPHRQSNELGGTWGGEEWLPASQKQIQNEAKNGTGLGALFGPLWGAILGAGLGPDSAQEAPRCAQERHHDLPSTKILHLQKS